MASLTLLDIVDKHSIDIDYNEQAIVKAFKLILLDLELLYSAQDSPWRGHSSLGMGSSYGSENSDANDSESDDTAKAEVSRDTSQRIKKRLKEELPDISKISETSFQSISLADESVKENEQISKLNKDIEHSLNLGD